MAVFIDSSVWISASNPRNKEASILKKMIISNELIYVCHLIQVEVSQGARSEAEFHKVWDSFLGFSFLDMRDPILWQISAWNYLRCRKKGLTPTTADCLIATLSSEYKVPLLTLDHFFKKAQPIIGFELFSA